MATTRDGLKLPYPPDAQWLAIGVVLLIAGVVVMLSGVLPGPGGLVVGLFSILSSLLKKELEKVHFGSETLPAAFTILTPRYDWST